MKKQYELRNIDDFIIEFNNPNHKLGSLKRVSSDNQENPDALCLLDGGLKVGLEATVVMLPEDQPFSKIPQNQSTTYNPIPILEILVERIKKKSINDYTSASIDEVWLLISGGSYISDHDLKNRIASEELNTRFGRIFIHKGLTHSLLEIIEQKY